MQYQALYRKYRPQRFDEVIGQDHVTSTLAREVIEDKVAHAYLFTGPRGTGKTTSARLLAKALNCTNRGGDGEPCNVCPSCLGIIEGTSLDVIELDAASHNKVEDVREIRANVGTVAAAAGAKRVYILDEAHMLSRAAGNALLKTLEEPPEHVVFVLATTEPYKLLDTIRSRSQRFDFHPVASETLIDYLADIAAREDFGFDHAALSSVTAHAGGSVRDAMSLLEQVAALGGGTVTSDGVERALGLADRDSFRRLIDSMAREDAAAGLTLVSDLARKGADLRRFVADSIGYLRGVFLTQYASNVEEVVDAPRETIVEWRDSADKISSAEVLRAIDQLSEALVQLRDGREERLVVELAVIRLAKPEVVPDLEALTARVARVERDLRDTRRSAPSPVDSAPIKGESAEPHIATGAKADLDPDRPFAAPVDREGADGSAREATTAETPDIAGAEATEDTTGIGPSESFGIKDFERVWPAIVASIRPDVGPRRHALLREAVPVAVEGSTVTFEVAAHMHFHLEQLKADDGLASAIAASASDQLGTPIKVAYRSAEATDVVDDPERAPDKDDLTAVDGDDGIDPTDTVLELLGGEIVHETGRD
jgi:DNA polymerase III subunit gamma/tau